MDSGITASMNAARDAKPSASSMACWSAASGPMCRWAKALWHSSAARDKDERFIRRSGCSSFMRVPAGAAAFAFERKHAARSLIELFADRGAVRTGIDQPIRLGIGGGLDLEEPAFIRRAVDLVR